MVGLDASKMELLSRPGMDPKDRIRTPISIWLKKNTVRRLRSVGAMERGPIISDYFRLRYYLNRANKLSNQVTELRFEIEEVQLFEYNFFAVSQGKNELHKIALAERTGNKIWERTGNTRFGNLEEFCAECLNEFEKSRIKPFRPRKLAAEVQVLMAQETLARLKMLLLKKNYEP